MFVSATGQRVSQEFREKAEQTGCMNEEESIIRDRDIRMQSEE